MKSIILELQDKSKEELLKETLTLVRKNQEDCNSFVTVLDDVSLNKEDSSSLLNNIPYALKDNFSTKDILTTGSSNTLKDYIPPYNSTVYQKLLEAGALCIGKTVMDEFGMGGTGTTGHTGVVKNPWNTEYIAGGSSAGAAASVASGAVSFAIGSDTGDSIRKPAAFCGIVGYKPTYGMISRWGLFPFASSLDHVGVLTRSVVDAAIVVDAIKGKDEHDMTSWDSSKMNLQKSATESLKENVKLCYFKELATIDAYQNPSEELKTTIKLFHETINKIKRLGITIEETSFDETLLEVMSSVYTCISCAEATSNMSNLTGIIFGPRSDKNSINEMIIDHRTKGFSPLIKRRFIIGSYVLQRENQEKYFVNAQRIRGLIVEKMKEIFKTYDAVILPCSASHAPKLKDATDTMKKELTAIENHMVIGNFGGFPSITIPNGLINSLPIGINVTSNIYEDEKLLNIAAHIEEVIDFNGLEIGGAK